MPSVHSCGFECSSPRMCWLCVEFVGAWQRDTFSTLGVTMMESRVGGTPIIRRRRSTRKRHGSMIWLVDTNGSDYVMSQYVERLSYEQWPRVLSGDARRNCHTIWLQRFEIVRSRFRRLNIAQWAARYSNAEPCEYHRIYSSWEHKIERVCVFSSEKNYRIAWGHVDPSPHIPQVNSWIHPSKHVATVLSI